MSISSIKVNEIFTQGFGPGSRCVFVPLSREFDLNPETQRVGVRVHTLAVVGGFLALCGKAVKVKALESGCVRILYLNRGSLDKWLERRGEKGRKAYEESISSILGKLKNPSPINWEKLESVGGRLQEAKTDILLTKDEQINFTDVKQEKVLKLQSKIQSTNPEHPDINLQNCLRNGYLPQLTLEIGGVIYYYSKPFEKDKRLVSFALVQLGDKVYPRLFYLSRSQGTWRSLPVMAKGGWKAVFGRHWGKGLQESDTQLPIVLSMALLRQLSSDLAKLEEKCDLSPLDDIVKGGMDFSNDWLKNVKLEPFASLREGALEYFELGVGERIRKTPDPNSIGIVIGVTVDRKKLPNFKFPLFECQISLELYGEVKARVFGSFDQTVQYLFYEQEDGKAFLASVESVMAKINCFGVRDRAFQLCNMDSPLREYLNQIPRKYFTSGMVDSAYWCNWNYVREIAIIQWYYQRQNRKIPDPI